MKQNRKNVSFFSSGLRPNKERSVDSLDGRVPSGHEKPSGHREQCPRVIRARITSTTEKHDEGQQPGAR